MFLGYNTNGLAHHRLIDAVELLAGIGYRGVAITIDHHALSPFSGNTNRQLGQLRGLLERHEMRSVVETGARFLLDPATKHEPTLLSSAQRRRIDFYRHAVDCAAALGSDCMSLWSGAPHEVVPRATTLDRLIEGLHEVAESQHVQGVMLGIEPEPGMLIDSMRRVGRDLAEDRGSQSSRDARYRALAVPGRNSRRTRDWPMAFATWSTCILKTCALAQHEHLMFGEGEIDFPPVLRALANVGYTGGVYVELSRHSHEGPVAARRALSFLKTCFCKADFMPHPVVLLSIPALREKDVAAMPRLRKPDGRRRNRRTDAVLSVRNLHRAGQHDDRQAVRSTWHRGQRAVLAQAAARSRCGRRPTTASSNCRFGTCFSTTVAGMTSAVWFPMHSKGCEADYVCTPAPIHNPDGSESLWCYTRPLELYGELRDRAGPFSLDELLGTDDDAAASDWIARSAVMAAGQWQPDFFYVYLPHLDYAAHTPAPTAMQRGAVAELDEVIARLAEGMERAYHDKLLWLAAGEYAMTPVEHVTYPNRVLREAGLLAVREDDGGECLDIERSQAFAMVDHQFSHIFIANGDEQLAWKIADLFRHRPGIAEVLWSGAVRHSHRPSPQRRGDPDLHAAKLAGVLLVVGRRSSAASSPVALISTASRATIRWSCSSIPRPTAFRSTPRVHGSHGARPLILPRKPCCWPRSHCGFPAPRLSDTDVFGIVLRHFGLHVS